MDRWPSRKKQKNETLLFFPLFHSLFVLSLASGSEIRTCSIPIASKARWRMLLLSDASIHTLNNVSCGRPDREKKVTASAPPMTLSRSASAKRNHASKRSWSAEDMLA